MMKINKQAIYRSVWLKKIYHSIQKILAKSILFFPKRFLIPLMRYMAETGEGTDECFRHGFLPMRVHFYSPVPDIQDLEKRKIWDRVSHLKGVDFRKNEQLALLSKLGVAYGEECGWQKDRPADPYQFWTHNGGFSYGCAAPLHTIIRTYKPKRVIEIGSGCSSLVIAAALRKNKTEDENYHYKYIAVDPYPWIDGLPGLTELRKERVELVEESLFQQLEENDILFIDSGHTVRIGGDVNYLVLDILPALKPGVFVHVHDVGLPYEYQKVYCTNPAFRVFWTEAYLIQSFMTYNSEFEVLLAMNYLQTKHMDEFCKAFPRFDLKINWATSGSFWIRRKV